MFITINMISIHQPHRHNQNQSASSWLFHLFAEVGGLISASPVFKSWVSAIGVWGVGLRVAGQVGFVHIYDLSFLGR